MIQRTTILLCDFCTEPISGDPHFHASGEDVHGCGKPDCRAAAREWSAARSAWNMADYRARAAADAAAKRRYDGARRRWSEVYDASIATAADFPATPLQAARTEPSPSPAKQEK